MANISKKIQDWVEAGIINSGQGDSILEYEEAHRPKNLGVYTIIAMGAIVICIGIISLIAANWDDIPDFVKLFLDFLILASMGFSIYKTRDNEKNIINEILILVFSLLILGSIGLISQIFHTGGELYQALGFWCAITLPLVLHSTGRFNSHFWLLSFLYSLFNYLEVEIFKHSFDSDLFSYFIISEIFGLILLGKLLQKTKIQSLITFGDTSQFWGVLNLMAGTIIFSFMDEIKSSDALNIILGLYCISSLLVFYNEIKENSKKAIIFMIGSVLFFVFLCSHIYDFNGKFLDAFLFILIWFAIGFYFHLCEGKRLFEFSITVIGLRFLVVYFQLFASLALTGIGLIFSGILIILLSVGYIKNRKTIMEKLGGII